MISCIIAEDHTLFRECVRESLEASNRIKIIADYGNAREAAEEAIRRKADVLLLDIMMSGPSSFDSARWARKENRLLKVIFVTGSMEDVHLIEAIRCGAHGYVEKAAGLNELRTAIERVYRGDKYLPAADRLIGKVQMVPRISMLTPRERDVFKLLAEGNTAKEIALMLDISVKTVEVHKFNLMQKLDIHNKAQLVKYAITYKVIPVTSMAVTADFAPLWLIR